MEAGARSCEVLEAHGREFGFCFYGAVEGLGEGSIVSSCCLWRIGDRKE